MPERELLGGGGSIQDVEGALGVGQTVSAACLGPKTMLAV